ncbi:hypothetical protein LINPERPRIM_LOCUS32796 [Linum perenne]
MWCGTLATEELLARSTPRLLLI